MERAGDLEQRKYLYNDIVERIGAMIDSGKFKVGERLPAERTLAREFAVSRNCVRQAIQALSEKRVLESRRGDGTYVCASDRSALLDSFDAAIQAQKEAIRDIIQFRLLLEPQIASLAAKSIRKEQLDRLKITVCDQERKVLAGEKDADLDASFHRQLAAASGNRVVQKVFDAIDGILNESRSEFLQSDARRRNSVVGHLKIIDALEARDGDKAFESMKEHLLAVERSIFGTDGPDALDEERDAGLTAQ